jgi:hypothetical protein
MPSLRRTLTVAAALAAVALPAAAVAAPAPAAPAHPAAGDGASAHALATPARSAAVLVRPRARQRVSGLLRPRVAIRGRARVTRLELRVDGRRRLAWSPRRATAPALDTRRLSNGRHVLELRVRAGRRTQVHRRIVTVVNPAPRSRRAPGGAPSPATAPAPAEHSSPAPGPAAPPSGDGLAIPGVIMRTGDFNSGGLAGWSGSQWVSGYSLNVVSSPAREGGYAARFEVRRGDDPLCIQGWGCFGDRSEVQMSTGEAEGQERWYSWSTMIGADFPRYSTWQVVSQWHANADGSPPIGFYAENDDLVLRFHRHSGPGRLMNIVDAWRGSLRRGDWQDIRLHVKWSASDSVGFVELWINGVPQRFDDGGTRRHIRNLYPGGIGNYFKQGLYRQSGLSQTGVVHHDGFRMSRPA